MFDEVNVVIPGASNVTYVEPNIRAADLPPLSGEQMNTVEEIYTRHFKSVVHHLW
jgi:aryl-alcohol dehydrogenase-like predicted oxidoreductase